MSLKCTEMDEIHGHVFFFDVGYIPMFLMNFLLLDSVFIMRQSFNAAMTLNLFVVAIQ